MNLFNDITLINNDDSPIIAEQKKMMNEDVVIQLNRIYKEGFDCICGKNVKILHKHINSSKHKRFVAKHNINIEIIKQPKKEKKPVNNIIGRPKKYIDDTPDKRKERNRKYMINYFDNKNDKREEQNKRVAKFREENRELCRERVRRCRLRKKELLKQA